jgi:hypothetical protein
MSNSSEFKKSSRHLLLKLSAFPLSHGNRILTLILERASHILGEKSKLIVQFSKESSEYFLRPPDETMVGLCADREENPSDSFCGCGFFQ